MSEKAKNTILNVDDNDANRYALSRILIREGFDVVEAESGLKALRLVRQKPDLVLLDVNLPDINGFEVCRLIKEDPDTALIPVLHVSATYRNDDAKIRGLETGADGYLTHPLEPPVLIAYVKSLLRIGEAEKRLEAAAQQWRATFDAIGHYLCILDKGQRVQQCNKSMQAFVQKPFSKIIGRYCWEIIHGTSRPAESCPLTKMKNTRRRITHVSHIGERWFDITVDPLLDNGGSLSGTVHIMADITARKQAEDLAKKAYAELERRVRERTEDLHRLSSRLLELQEEERKRVAMELHDGIGQTLAAIKYRLEREAERGWGSGRKQSDNLVRPIVSMVRDAIEEVRIIQKNLRPSVLDDLGILATMSWFCREFEMTYPGICIEKHIDVQEHDVPDSLKIIIFRVMQEGFNNIAKHSQADHVDFSLAITEDKIEMSISDNGVGITAGHELSDGRSEKGLGLASIRERIEFSGGSFSIESRRNEGTTLRGSWLYKDLSL